MCKFDSLSVPSEGSLGFTLGDIELFEIPCSPSSRRAVLSYCIKVANMVGRVKEDLIALTLTLLGRSSLTCKIKRSLL